MAEESPPLPMNKGGPEEAIRFAASSIAPSSSISCWWIKFGSFLTSLIIIRIFSGWRLEIDSAKRRPVATILVNTFVEATANSVPACKYTPFPVSLDSVEPIMLQNDAILLPLLFASNIASIVSFVSPDCEIPIVRELLEHTDFAGNSLAMNVSQVTEEKVRM